ncbi:GNAT family N-acetyltransferase [Psychrosphaera sp.]|nr:GNAT family N-acetyltransferase [Psychrosphaera sp.]
MNYKTDKVSWRKSSKEIRAIREQVFIYEYQFPLESEFDQHDVQCEHVLVRDEQGVAIATGRLSDDGKISRVAVLMKHRNIKVRRKVIKELLQLAKTKGLTKVYFDSHLDEVDKYQDQGFVPAGNVYMDAGIAKQPLTCALELFKIAPTVLH